MKSASVAIIENEGKFLIAKRKLGGVVGGKWEFPGGKIEKDESPQDCLKRELKEELDVETTILDFFDEHVHRYKNGIFRILAYNVDCASVDFRLCEHDEVRWVSIQEMVGYDFVGNDKPIIKKLSLNSYVYGEKTQ